MKTAHDHVILTRFNLPSKGPESFIRSQDGWLIDRVMLFEQYCLPSVRMQSSKDFEWIIYFDPESPAWLRERIKRWSRDPVFSAIYREEVSRDNLLHDLRSVTGAKRQHLLTTNLDNDDGLSRDFVERLQSVRVHRERQAIYLTQGLIKNGNTLYRHLDRENAFCSVLENWENAVTCWVDWHNRLADHMSTTEVADGPAWLQVIHERNVSNRVHGRRVPAGSFIPNFGQLIGDVNDPNWYDTALDRLWDAPRRFVYEATRAGVKKATMLVGGKPALDRMKVLLQQGKTGK
ncbi:glycosyltransferase [Paeniglutamicibacter sp.]|uniref:glycosyltransferase n=1 Tax=Paeniglutamicibacter sp. TaxID=1934391 RepID=UPI003989AF49